MACSSTAESAESEHRLSSNFLARRLARRACRRGRQNDPTLQRRPVQLVYDGGCPFCRFFAATSELRGGVANLEIIDGRADSLLRQQLAQQGFNLADGAILIEGDRCWHGADAVSRLCGEMDPSDGLLRLLSGVFDNQRRSRRLYPLLLLARRLALAIKGLPLDPATQRG